MNTANNGEPGTEAHRWWKLMTGWSRRILGLDQPSGGWWGWRSGPPYDLGPRNVLVTIDHQVDHWTFMTPAQGEAHDFSVEVYCSWSASRSAPSHRDVATTESELMIDLSRVRQGIHRRVVDEVRTLARRYPPYRAAEAERDIGAAVETCMGDGDIRCRITLRIDVDEAVRQELRAFSSHLMKLDLDLDYSRHKAERLLAVQEAWQQVLSRGLTDLDAVFGNVSPAEASALDNRQPWMTPSALLLAEQPGDVSSVMRAMLNERVSEGQKLLTSLAGAVRLHQKVDAYEIMLESDVALREIMHGLGVPVPQQAAVDGQEL